jgi:hypothetical protein
MTFFMASTNMEVQKTLRPIQAYPAFSVDMAETASSVSTSPLRALWISAQAATTELRTMRPKDRRARGVTLPPNHKTSPYAMTMMVRFLKMV